MLINYFKKGWIYLILSLFMMNHVEASWSFPPVTISPQEFTGSFGSFDPNIGISSSGYAVAVWAGSDVSSGNTVIQSATSQRGGTWSPFVTITSFVPLSDPLPRVAVDLAGNAVAIWIFFDGISNQSVYASNMPKGGAWSTPVQISPSTTSFAQIRAQLALDKNGNGVAVWQIQIGSDVLIQSASFQFGSKTWSSPLNIATVGTNHQSPQVGVDNVGDAIAVWQNTTTQTIQSSTLLFNSGAWTNPVNISGPVNADRAQIAVDPQGNAVAVWRNENNVTIESSSFTFESQAWSGPQALSSPQDFVDEPLVKVGQNGNAVATWVFSNGGIAGVQSAIKPFKGNWSAAQSVSNAGATDLTLSLGVDSLGNAIAIWVNDVLSVSPIVQAANLNFQTNTWTTPTFISNTALDEIIVTSLAVDPSGYAVAIWENNDGEFEFIEAVNFTPADPIPPAEFCGVITNCHFPYTLKTCWTASTSPGIVSYNIFKGKKLVATVPATALLTFKICLDFCRAHVKSYSITAINSDGIESTPQPIVIRKKCPCH